MSNNQVELSNEAIEKLRNIQLDILEAFDWICQKNHIRYSLSAGTLLGAVRHKGFIPWDDDIDVMMLRDEYEKFLRVMESIKDDFYLVNFSNDEHFAFGFSKLMVRGTLMRETIEKNKKIPHSVFIDIFPLDKTSNNLQEQFDQYEKAKKIKKQLWMRGGYGFDDGVLKKAFWKTKGMLLKLIPKKHFINNYLENAHIYDDCNTDFVVSLSGEVGLKKAVYRKECFEKYTKVEFEKRQFMAITDYDYYLTELYGDYMTLPPASQQHPHHYLLEYDFSNYTDKKGTSHEKTRNNII